jgi:hypothetical protein
MFYNAIIVKKESRMRLILLTLFFISSLSSESGILDIKWPKPNLQHQKPSMPYPTVLLEGIKNSKLPVYLPSSYAYDKKMIVVADKNFYTISFLLQGATLMISGDRTFQESISPSNTEFQKVVKSKAVVFREEEGIMNTDFNRHGVNYTLSIECEQPKKDKRCQEEIFLHNLYNKLIMVGGRP